MNGVAVRSVLPMPRATMATDGSGMLSKKTWAVVGNHGKNPVVGQLTERLRSNGKTVYRVNPYGKPPPSTSRSRTSQTPPPWTAWTSW